MVTMTMPATAERTQPNHTQGVSQLMPLLLAMVLLAAVAVASVLIFGPMH